MSDYQETSTAKWYCQFWPWFIMALPATVVVAGITTVVIAFYHSDNLVTDDHYRKGLAINKSLSRDDNASAMGLFATLAFDNANGITLSLKGYDTDLPSPQYLLLNWEHPTSAQQDFSVTLVKQTEGIYYSTLSSTPVGRWYLTLRPLSADSSPGNWQLRREILLRATAATDEQGKQNLQQQFQFQSRCLQPDATRCKND